MDSHPGPAPRQALFARHLAASGSSGCSWETHPGEKAPGSQRPKMAHSTGLPTVAHGSSIHLLWNPTLCQALKVYGEKDKMVPVCKNMYCSGFPVKVTRSSGFLAAYFPSYLTSACPGEKQLGKPNPGFQHVLGQ